MDNISDLERLADLKKKGIVTEMEFEEQKQLLLRDNISRTTDTPKSRVVYILLALFLGTFGIHNFYAGYVGRGLAQLLITIFLFWLVVPLLAVWIWVIVEMIVIDKDAQGVKFN